MIPIKGMLLDTSKPFRVTLINAQTKQPYETNDKRKAFITVYSRDSKYAKGYRVPDGLSDEEKAADFVAYLSTGPDCKWLLIDEKGDGAEETVSREDARALFVNPDAVDLFDQVWSGAAGRGNFAKASSNS